MVLDSKRSLRPEDGRVKVKAKDKLIEATYFLPSTEQKVLSFCISIIDMRASKSWGAGFTISKDDLISLFDNKMDEDSAIKSLKNLEKSLYDRTINFVDGDVLTKIRWVHKVKFNKNLGILSLFFSDELRVFLDEYRDDVCIVKAGVLSRFETSYGYNLYEVLKLCNQSGCFEVSVDQLRYELQAENRYKNIKDFKRYVLNTAIEDINKNTSHSISIDSQIKDGSRIVSIVFEVD